MSSINTVSGNGNKNYVSGLASGMDTESQESSDGYPDQNR